MLYSNNSEDAILALEYQRTGGYGEVPELPIHTCAICGEKIYDGEDCLNTDDGVFCRRCIMSMTSEDIVELLGFSFERARIGDSKYY